MWGGSVTNSKLYGTAECVGGGALIDNEDAPVHFDRVTAYGGVFNKCKGFEEGATVSIWGGGEIDDSTVTMQDSYICGGGKIHGYVYPTLSGKYVDLGGNYVDVACCFSDLDHDGSVGGGDLTILLGAWGPGCLGCQADLDDNGVVDGADP